MGLKSLVKPLLPLLAIIGTTSSFAQTQPSSNDILNNTKHHVDYTKQNEFETAGGLAPGESSGGVIDTLFVTAPPHWFYVVEKQAGSFVDCGNGSDYRSTDHNGRDSAALTCGVTLTETLVVPAASQSARLIVHY